MTRNHLGVLLVFFLYKTGEFLLEPVVKLYLYREVCRSEVSNDAARCKDLGNDPQLEDEVQERASTLLMWYRILQNAPAIALSLVSGSWSDQVGRKVCNTVHYLSFELFSIRQ